MTPLKRRSTDAEEEARAAASLWKKLAVWAVTALIATGGGIGSYQVLEQRAPRTVSAVSDDASRVQLDRAISDIAGLNVKVEQLQASIARIEGNVAFLVSAGGIR